MTTSATAAIQDISIWKKAPGEITGFFVLSDFGSCPGRVISASEMKAIMSCGIAAPRMDASLGSRSSVITHKTKPTSDFNIVSQNALEVLYSKTLSRRVGLILKQIKTNV